MDFAVIGTLSSYVKQKNLTFAAKHKIRTGQTLTNANGDFISMNTSAFDKLREAAKASLDQAKAQKLARIKQKLKAGEKLTDEELGFLRVNDPKTYKKAKSVDEAREELKADLKKAKTKGEAREAMTRAMIKASSEAVTELSGQGGGNISTGSAMTAGGEISAQGGENFSCSENPTPETSAENFSDAQKNFDTQKTSDAEKNSPEDIMEKYLWKIRALENEWAKFTNSKAYKDLPEHETDIIAAKKILDEPDRKILRAVLAYRKSMTA